MPGLKGNAIMTETLDCGHAPSESSPITNGRGYDSAGKSYCYDCCASREWAAMIDTGRACLYLSGRELIDWPGKLRFPVHYIAKGRHNMARVRYDGQFTGPDGRLWRFTQYGDNTQVAHCRRLKTA